MNDIMTFKEMVDAFNDKNNVCSINKCLNEREEYGYKPKQKGQSNKKPTIPELHAYKLANKLKGTDGKRKLQAYVDYWNETHARIDDEDARYYSSNDIEQHKRVRKDKDGYIIPLPDGRADITTVKYDKRKFISNLDVDIAWLPSPKELGLPVDQPNKKVTASIEIQDLNSDHENWKKWYHIYFYVWERDPSSTAEKWKKKLFDIKPPEDFDENTDIRHAYQGFITGDIEGRNTDIGKVIGHAYIDAWHLNDNSAKKYVNTIQQLNKQIVLLNYVKAKDEHGRERLYLNPMYMTQLDAKSMHNGPYVSIAKTLSDIDQELISNCKYLFTTDDEGENTLVDKYVQVTDEYGDVISGQETDIKFKYNKEQKLTYTNYAIALTEYKQFMEQPKHKLTCAHEKESGYFWIYHCGFPGKDGTWNYFDDSNTVELYSDFSHNKDFFENWSVKPTAFTLWHLGPYSSFREAKDAISVLHLNYVYRPINKQDEIMHIQQVRIPSENRIVKEPKPESIYILNYDFNPYYLIETQNDDEQFNALNLSREQIKQYKNISFNCDAIIVAIDAEAAKRKLFNEFINFFNIPDVTVTDKIVLSKNTELQHNLGIFNITINDDDTLFWRNIFTLDNDKRSSDSFIFNLDTINDPSTINVDSEQDIKKKQELIKKKEQMINSIAICRNRIWITNDAIIPWFMRTKALARSEHNPFTSNQILQTLDTMGINHKDSNEVLTNNTGYYPCMLANKDLVKQFFCTDSTTNSIKYKENIAFHFDSLNENNNSIINADNSIINENGIIKFSQNLLDLCIL